MDNESEIHWDAYRPPTVSENEYPFWVSVPPEDVLPEGAKNARAKIANLRGLLRVLEDKGYGIIPSVVTTNADGDEVRTAGNSLYLRPGVDPNRLGTMLVRLRKRYPASFSLDLREDAAYERLSDQMISEYVDEAFSAAGQAA